MGRFLVARLHQGAGVLGRLHQRQVVLKQSMPELVDQPRPPQYRPPPVGVVEKAGQPQGQPPGSSEPEVSDAEEKSLPAAARQRAGSAIDHHDDENPREDRDAGRKQNEENSADELREGAG